MDEDDIELISGLPVSGILSGKGEIQPGTIPEGKIIICMYRGAYAGMAQVYNGMHQWIKDNGYEGTGTSYEHYYSGPGLP